MRRGYAFVDDEDYERVMSAGPWHLLTRANACSYAVHTSQSKTNVFMHRLIMGALPGQDVDHINHSGLDNRQANLRICTRSQNMANQRVRRGTRYKGVSWNTADGAWRAHIKVSGRQRLIGTFASEEDAARAYDAAAVTAWGEFARLNAYGE